MLASFCSLSQEIVDRNQIDFESYTLVSMYMLHETTVQAEVHATSEFYKSAESARIQGFLNYLRAITHGNSLVSGLNTNFMIAVSLNESELMLGVEQTSFLNVVSYHFCGNKNLIEKAYFVTPLNETEFGYYYSKAENTSFPRVAGFYGACTTLEALLESTLDCLYDVECLALVRSFFPAVQRVCTIFSIKEQQFYLLFM